MIEVRNFLPNPEEIRAMALRGRWRNLAAFDGQVYGRVQDTPIPGLHEAIEEVIGPCFILGQGFRLNYAGELPNHAIHTDRGWGTHALVLYLSRAPNGFGDTGTAFWSYSGHDDPEVHTDTPGDWEQTDLCKEEFGKAVIYPSSRYHSRWPFAAYGKVPVDGRLIGVAFFSPLNQ